MKSILRMAQKKMTGPGERNSKIVKKLEERALCFEMNFTQTLFSPNHPTSEISSNGFLCRHFLGLALSLVSPEMSM